MPAKRPKPRPLQVGYTSDLSKPYAESLRKVKTETDLRAHVDYWKLVAADAFDAVNAEDFSWKVYRAGAEQEKRNIFAGEEWVKKYGAILMPEVLMRISIIAMQYVVPDGVVFIRLRDEGHLIMKDGKAYMRREEPNA